MKGWQLVLLLILAIPAVQADNYHELIIRDGASNTTVNVTGCTIGVSKMRSGNGLNFSGLAYNVSAGNISGGNVNLTAPNSLQYSCSFPQATVSGNLVTITNNLSATVIDAVFYISTGGIVPFSPSLTFPNGSTYYLASVYDNVSGVAQFSISLLTPGSTNVTLSNLCGDGFVTCTEQCDLGVGNNGACPITCSSSCVVSSCSSTTTAGDGGGVSGSGSVGNLTNASLNTSVPVVNVSPVVAAVVNTSTGSMALTIDRARYGPGDMLTGSVTVVDNSSLGGTLTYLLVDPHGNKYPGVSILLLPGTSTKLLNYSLPLGAEPGTWTLQAVLSHDGQLPVAVSADFTVTEPLITSTSGLVVAVLIGLVVVFLVIVGVAILVMVRRKPANRGPPPVTRRRDPWE